MPTNARARAGPPRGDDERDLPRRHPVPPQRIGVSKTVAFEQAARSRDARDAPRMSRRLSTRSISATCSCWATASCSTVKSARASTKIGEQIERVGTLGDAAGRTNVPSAFGGVAPANHRPRGRCSSRRREARPRFRLARCATNVLDLFHLPHDPPSEPGPHLLKFVDAKRQATPSEIEEIESKKHITGRRFYAAMLSDETAFSASCDARQRVELTEEVLAVLFMNFRLRLAEERSIANEKVFVGDDDGGGELADTLVYLPRWGGDFSREFSRFIRWGSDTKSRHGHAFDLGCASMWCNNGTAWVSGPALRAPYDSDRHRVDHRIVASSEVAAP